MKPNDIVLEVQHLTQVLGGRCVLFDISIKVLRGEIVALVGPSGCGKSTLLRAILGTEPATDGQVIIYGGPGKVLPKMVKEPSSDCGIVPQNYLLFPHMTALQNVAVGLMFSESTIPDRMIRWVPRKRPKRGSMSWAQLRKVHLKEAEDFLNKFKLGDAKGKYPHQLSGGMQQRVAIAQALIMKPKILLMDEPFGALDQATRGEMQEMLLGICQDNVALVRDGNAEKCTTIVIVTHELDEAILVGDRVIGLSQHWDSKGHPDPRAKGASTVVYDRAAPVFLPEQEVQHTALAEQGKEVFRVVFDPEFLTRPNEYRRIWEDIEAGRGRGVLSKEIWTKSAEGGGKDG